MITRILPYYKKLKEIFFSENYIIAKVIAVIGFSLFVESSILLHVMQFIFLAYFLANNSDIVFNLLRKVLIVSGFGMFAFLLFNIETQAEILAQWMFISIIVVVISEIRAVVKTS